MNCQTDQRKLREKFSQSYGGKTKHQMKCRGTHSSGGCKEQQNLQADELQAIATTQEKHPGDVTCHHCRIGPQTSEAR